MRRAAGGGNGNDRGRFEEVLAAPGGCRPDVGRKMAKHMGLSNKYNIGKCNIGCSSMSATLV